MPHQPHRGQAAVQPLWIWFGLPLLAIGLYVIAEVLL